MICNAPTHIGRILKRVMCARKLNQAGQAIDYVSTTLNLQSICRQAGYETIKYNPDGR